MNNEFWTGLQMLVDSSQIIIDRAKGSIHPSMGGEAYPVDYGHLQDTNSTDGSEVDVWIGTLNTNQAVGVQCTVDLFKRDVEIKILVDCTDDEIISIDDFTNSNTMQAFYIRRLYSEEK